MKNVIIPINNELLLRDEHFIVSKTDPKGLITYCNRIFIEFSGYTEAELLGQQHNIIRHPDMPRAVFKLLWDTLKVGNEFIGYVKNMSKDGSFYWVFATVTPSFNNNQLLGYFSVRRKPDPHKVQLIDSIYRKMLQVEQASGAKDAINASTEVLIDLVSATGKSYHEFIVSF